ncbi:MAG: class I SAM-dependent methyltransferase [Tannerellaceae bacterium]|jgi:2-polyprenyl-3-methyl-5-hydroxy-6-metoxy-1,4-benzoquinol methylase|nr:class I SAM-dependent methyltransferase [Tannerellaceae bacterium]
MKRSELIEISQALASKLQSVDYDKLPISNYNKQYIYRIYSSLPYYLKIYADCIYKGIISTKISPSGITFIDYGGGNGFLSFLAKEIGIKQVIYIDLNPLSVETVKVLKQQLTIGPDIILQGNSDALANWCEARQITPQLLIATDLIEHVYDLERFFSDLCGINPGMEMIFTTASNPCNPIVKRRLHKFMQACELGMAVEPNYYTRRKNFIEKHYPNLSEKQVEAWSRCTCGLIYDDIRKAIKINHQPVPEDKYNTCDPETGNWAERILPVRYYKDLLELYDYKLIVRKGFYNIRRNNVFTSCLFRCMNGFIRCFGRLGLFLSPYIILHGRK